jgi:hypothetical protein
MTATASSKEWAVYRLYVRYYDDGPWIVIGDDLYGHTLIERAGRMARQDPDMMLVLKHRYDAKWFIYWNQGMLVTPSSGGWSEWSVQEAVLGECGVPAWEG